MKFFGVKNLASHEATECTPWEYKPEYPTFLTEGGYKKWAARKDTDHLFYSAWEGLTASLRVTKDNPPAEMHALVLDIDSKLTTAEVQSLCSKLSEKCRPVWISQTRNKRARVVWEFQKPVLIPSTDIGRGFCKEVMKFLNVQAVFPGIDPSSVEPYQLWEVGTGWFKVSDNILSKQTLHKLLFEVSNRSDFASCGVTIPMDRIEEEVSRRFPGKWDGSFEVGKRGVRFWDHNADNKTAAVVRETGMQCFTGTKAFRTWSDIFGNDFVREFREAQIESGSEGIWYDGLKYWWRIADNTWKSFCYRDLQIRLRMSGFDTTKDRQGTSSEADKVVNFIHENRHVDGVLPLCHRDQIVRIQERQYLNVSRVKCMAPAKETQEWGENFPWLASFFDGFLSPDDSSDYFFAWLKRYYISALEHHPLRGQVVFLCGGVHAGKNMVTDAIISKMVGGHADASDYVAGGAQFNGHLFQAPLWTVHDVKPPRQSGQHAEFSSMVKRAAANSTFTYNEKFEKAVTTPWVGRLVVTLNDDPQSFASMINLDKSNLDKIMLFKVANRDFQFPSEREITATINRELPYFCRWLKDWTPPEGVLERNRFGVKPYHETELYETARDSSESGAFIEVVETHFRNLLAHGSSEPWRGNVTTLFEEINISNSHAMSRYSLQQFARQLRQAQSVGSDVLDIEYTKNYREKPWSFALKQPESATTNDIEMPF